MSSYDPYVSAVKFLYDTLTSPAIPDVTDVFEDVAPEGETGASDTWITFQLLAPGDDVWEVSAQTIWTEFVFLIRAVNRGRSTVALGDTAAEIKTRLHRVDGTVLATDAVVVSSTHQRPDHESWTSMGVEYRSLGGVYNLIVQPASA